MFRAHAPPQAACENLGSALKLLANLQAGGDDVVGTIFEGLLGQSRITNELEKSTEVVDQEAENMANLERYKGVLKEDDVPRRVRPRRWTN